MLGRGGGRRKDVSELEVGNRCTFPFGIVALSRHVSVKIQDQK